MHSQVIIKTEGKQFNKWPKENSRISNCIICTSKYFMLHGINEKEMARNDESAP